MAEKSELKLLLCRSQRSLSNVDNLFRDFPAECASHPKWFIQRERKRKREREGEMGDRVREWNEEKAREREIYE